MALDTYNGLKASIADWLQRGDLTSVIPDFIRLAEAKIARRLRTVTVRAGLAINGIEVELPAACVELRSIRFDADGHKRAIPIVTPEHLADFRSESQGLPRAAAVVDGVLLFNCVPDTSYDAEIIYYARLIPLAEGVQTNDVLTSAPDLYLYGSLMHAEPYLQNDERVAMWKVAFDEALAEEELARERSEYGASLRPMRLPVAF